MEKGQDLMQALRISTQIEQDADRILRSEGVDPVIPIVSEKCGQGMPGTIQLTTNVYGVTMKPVTIYRYDVTISADLLRKDGTTKRFELTKKTRGDAVVIDRRARCRDVFVVFEELNPEFIKYPKSVYYDLQSVLYSLNELAVPQCGVINFQVPSSKLGRGWEDFAGCDVEIRRVSEGFEMTLADLSSISRDLSQADTSMAQFLDIATSQHVMFTPQDHVSFSASSSYLMNHNQHGFKDSDTAVFNDSGAYLAIGAQKSVRFVEGPPSVRGRNAALVVETKKTAFHMVENLAQKASRVVRNVSNLSEADLARLNVALSGLYLETGHLGRFQRFIVHSLDSESANVKTIRIGDAMVTVADYYRSKYNIVLSSPQLPLVLCYVVDNQRVSSGQQTTRQVSEIIKKCAIPPCQLREQNNLTFKSLQLQNEFLSNAEIKVSSNPLPLNGRSLPPPELEFREGYMGRVRTDNFTWTGKKFFIPATCKKWAALLMLFQQDRLTQNDFEKFLDRFVGEACARGMSVPKVEKVKVLGMDMKLLRSEFEHLARSGIEFVLIVHSDAADDVNGNLKLYEREYSIVTQAIRYGTLMNMIQKGQPLTLQNIVNKANIKMGGLNYSLSLGSVSAREVLGTGTLYIGFGMNHAGGIGRMSEDGADADVASLRYAANYGLEHEFEFIDFICQRPQRDEKVDIIRTIVDRCLQKYRANRKAEPKKILLYRNGCGDGQFPMILKYEVPLIKLQPIRFFNKEIDVRARASDQNVKPGLVVDHSVVHPEYSEFFLTSHRALQGTARTPKYTVLFNENRISLEKLESITYQLCYGHQIVYMPTSLPSPVYIANRYAERGRKLYQRWIKSPSSDHSRIDYMEMSNRLGYHADSLLGNRRINA
uniref:Piwi domain-containing protein n=1 Tax=Ditylenchus dipsaci TaxID=166011 RepID=A0A915ECS8_9BILA